MADLSCDTHIQMIASEIQSHDFPSQYTSIDIWKQVNRCTSAASIPGLECDRRKIKAVCVRFQTVRQTATESRRAMCMDEAAANEDLDGEKLRVRSRSSKLRRVDDCSSEMK